MGFEMSHGSTEETEAAMTGKVRTPGSVALCWTGYRNPLGGSLT
jgi:hypothetical protein